MKHKFTFGLAAIVAISLGLAVRTGAAILVGTNGSGVITFSSAPSATEWATAPLAGSSSTYGNSNALNNGVQALASGGITTALTSTTVTPPATSSGGFQYNSTGQYLQTRPSSTAGNVLKATLQNDLGGTGNSLTLTYDFSLQSAQTAELPGLFVFYSLTGTTGSWVKIPTLSGHEVTGTVSATIDLSATPWPEGSLMYLLWADDNAVTYSDPSYIIDNVSFTGTTTNLPLALTLTAPADGEHFGSGQPISASVNIFGSPTNVSYYVDGSLAVERTEAPFSPVTLPAPALGAHTVQATARDAEGNTATSRINTFVVDLSLAGSLATDTTLYASNSPYTVAGNLTIPAGITLTIEPGVTLRMRKDCGITVNGRILADGTTNQPIRFTRYPGDLNWERIMFVKAADSRFRHCVFEYANCAGNHTTAYSAPDCDYPTNTPARTYFEAVVALASHLDFDNCIFTNLYNAAGTLAEGDAIAIVSDDRDHQGPASANIRGCQFLDIGQAIHTRYAYVLVENCYFVGKNGDNDDVDLYGESTIFGLPSPVIRYNLFDMPVEEDRINPTRCSAIIYGNIIRGSGDHGIVLRDTSCPIVFNNILYGCPNGGIVVQNGCDALLVNNTFYGISSAIKLFDHQSRTNYPYCLNPISGRATVVNCVIWNGSRLIDVSGASGAAFQEFQVSVSHCNIQGGTNAIYAGSNTRYRVEWGPGNISVDPLFLNATGHDYHVATNSPCLDAGGYPGTHITTNTLYVDGSRIRYPVTNELNPLVTEDLDRQARPLDSTGLGVARYDIGAYENLLASADSNGDGLPDGWCERYGFSPLAVNLAGEDSDGDFQSNYQEFLAGTDPTSARSYSVFPEPPGIGAVSQGRSIAWSNASIAGVVSILTATNVPGPWEPRENYFTTQPVGQAPLMQESDTLFVRLLAVDISTNSPGHYTNLIESYGVLETVAGLGLSSVDVSQWRTNYEGEWATNVCLSRPHISFGDSRGNVLIVDQRSSSVLKVTPEGRLYTYAGTHTAGDNGDGPAAATNLHLNNPNGGWLATNDVLYVLDTDNAKVRRVSPDGIMTTLFTAPGPMGDGRALWVKSDESVAYFGSGGTATNIYKWTPTGGVTLYRGGFGELGNILGDEQTGDLYISDRGANRVYRLSPDNILTPIAGNGTQSGGGDGQPALQTGLIAPRCVWFLPNGGFFTCEHSPGNRIWYIDPAGIIHRWMNGSDANNFQVGDGEWFYENPTAAKVSRVRSVNTDPFGNLIITESNYGYVRRIKFQRMKP